MKLTKNKKDNIIISSAIGALVIINIMLPTAGDFTYVAGAIGIVAAIGVWFLPCLLYTSPSPRDCS